jgi:adenosylcobyric acid synthase
VETVLTGSKRLCQAHGSEIASGARIRGYEMHIGATSGPDCARAWLRLEAESGAVRDEGGASSDCRILGCYVHGLFAADGFRRAYLERIAGAAREPAGSYEAQVDAVLDELADHLETSLDLDRLLEIARAR